MRNPHDAKKLFLAFLGKQVDGEAATTYIQDYTLLELWDTFKKLAYTPFQANHQGFIFEATNSSSTQGEQKQYIVFRRYFVLPFDEDLDALFQLTFECSALFSINREVAILQEWFQVEVESDAITAANAFILKVESMKELWSGYRHEEPEEIAIFM